MDEHNITHISTFELKRTLIKCLTSFKMALVDNVFQNPKKRFLNRWKSESYCIGSHSNEYVPTLPNNSANVEYLPTFTPEIMRFISQWCFTNDTEFPPVFGMGDSKTTTKATYDFETTLPYQDEQFGIKSTNIAAESSLNSKEGYQSRTTFQNYHHYGHVQPLETNCLKNVTTTNMRGSIKRWFLPEDNETNAVQNNCTRSSDLPNFDQETIVMSPCPSPKRQKMAARYEQPKSGPKSRTPISQLTCQYCKKVFAATSTARRHEMNSCRLAKNIRYDCATCGKSLSSYDSLVRHQRTLHNIKTKNI